MRRFLSAGLLGLTILFAGASSARADGFGFNFSYHASGSFGFSISPAWGGCGGGGGGCWPNPYASCAYAPYYQYGWPQSAPVYPDLPTYGYGPAPYLLPPAPYSMPYSRPASAPYYWSPSR